MEQAGPSKLFTALAGALAEIALYCMQLRLHTGNGEQCSGSGTETSNFTSMK